MEHEGKSTQVESAVIKSFHFGHKPNSESDQSISIGSKREATEENDVLMVMAKPDTENESERPADQSDADYDKLIAEFESLRLADGDHALHRGEIFTLIRETESKDRYKQAIKPIRPRRKK